jgi:hypothetical protein
MPDRNGNPISFSHIRQDFQSFILEEIDYPALTVKENSSDRLYGTFETENGRIIQFELRKL